MSYIEISVKRNDNVLTLRRTISTEQSAFLVFESMCSEVRGMLHEAAASEFEVVSSVANTSIDAEHYAEGIATSSAIDACQTSRAPADRIQHAELCGKACGRLLIGKCADFPADLPTRLRPSHYVLIRGRDGVCPETGIAVFSQWCDIQPYIQECHESSGKRSLGKQAIFKGLPSKSEVDAFICGFREQQRSVAALQ